MRSRLHRTNDENSSVFLALRRDDKLLLEKTSRRSVDIGLRFHKADSKRSVHAVRVVVLTMSARLSSTQSKPPRICGAVGDTSKKVIMTIVSYI